jgi:uncharacterized protein
MEWLGQAKISFTHSKTPIVLRRKDGSQINLAQVCEQTVPPCRLNPFLFNGHLQTMWTATKTEAPPIYYKRKVFESLHKLYPGIFAVDFAVPSHDQVDETLPPRTFHYTDDEFSKVVSDDSRPMLVVLHGLSGGSYEVYLRHAIAPLILNGGGW